MTKLDRDVRSLINHLYFKGSDGWAEMMAFLWSPDTEYDAAAWLEAGAGADEVRLNDRIRQFVIAVDEQIEDLPGGDFVFGYPVRDQPRQPGEPRPCFLAMPTRGWLSDVQRVIESAAPGFVCTLSVDLATPGNIMNQVWNDIRKSDVVLADLTGLNPNVFYELGLAHALGKDTILIKQIDGGDVPFDVQSHKYCEYDLADLATLEAWLTQAFRDVSARYRFDRAS
jgi:hypothetical protein